MNIIMKKVLIFGIFAFILLGLSALNGCDKSVDNPPVEVASIDGEWYGYLGTEEEEDTLSLGQPSWTIVFNQNGNELTALLTPPAELTTEPTLSLSGTLDTTMLSLSGTNQNATISLSGIVSQNRDLNISIDGLNNDRYFGTLHHTDSIQPVTASFSNTYKLDLKLGEVGRGRSIILVHGMNDNANTWNEMIEYLDDHSIDETNNVWAYEYKWWLNININGEQMLDTISKLQAINGISDAPIIIAHSMGGLVSRWYIAKGGDFHRLVTLGTPHLGSGLADLAYIFSWADVTGVHDLAPGSDFIDELNSHTYEQTQRSKYTLINGRVGRYFDCKAEALGHCVIPGWEWHYPEPPRNIKLGYEALSKPNDGMVPKSSARFYGDENVHRVNTFEWIDHISLNKNHRVCGWVKDFINNHQ